MHAHDSKHPGRVLATFAIALSVGILGGAYASDVSGGRYDPQGLPDGTQIPDFLVEVANGEQAPLRGLSDGRNVLVVLSARCSSLLGDVAALERRVSSDPQLRVLLLIDSGDAELVRRIVALTNASFPIALLADNQRIGLGATVMPAAYSLTGMSVGRAYWGGDAVLISGT